MLLNTFFLLIASISCSFDYSGQYILECSVSSKAEVNQLRKFDIIGHKKGKSIIRVKSLDEKLEAEKIVPCKVISDNIGKLLNTQSASKVRRQTDFNQNQTLTDEKFFSNYQRYEIIRSQYKQWALKYPHLTNYVGDIGKTHENRTIFAMDVTNRNFSGPKKDIVYIGGQHAREWISPATVAYITHKLITDFETDPLIKQHLNQYIFRIIPVANPDGYEYSHNKDRFWRKNRRQNSLLDYGVDLNRNWNDHWSLYGSSNYTWEDVYNGPSPNSEPEVQSIINYVMKFPKRYGVIDWHSFGQLILRNWGWTATDSKNEPQLVEASQKMVDAFKKHGYTYRHQKSSGLYQASGSADDWMTSVAGMFALTVELCPSEEKHDTIMGFALPATELLKCASSAYDASKAFVQYLSDNPKIPPNEILQHNITKY
jgi:carboxypeptidase A1